jgi:hypothetical protein
MKETGKTNKAKDKANSNGSGPMLKFNHVRRETLPLANNGSTLVAALFCPVGIAVSPNRTPFASASCAVASPVADFESELVEALVASGPMGCAASTVPVLLRPSDAAALTQGRRTRMATLTKLLNGAKDIRLVIEFMSASTSFISPCSLD